jgi:hypothetical protein
VEHVRGERGSSGAKLIEQSSGVVQHRYERLIIGRRLNGERPRMLPPRITKYPLRLLSR